MDAWKISGQYSRNSAYRGSTSELLATDIMFVMIKLRFTYHSSSLPILEFDICITNTIACIRGH